MRPLGAWAWTRVAVFLLALVNLRRDGDFLAGWDSWDATLFRKVAEFGYDGYPRHYPDADVEAFFPGFPLVLRAVHLVVPSWSLAGLVVSALALAVAVVFLSRLAALDGVDGSAAVLVLLVSPYAVFLAAPYSEALFLACALPAWWAARQGRWALASVLVAGACAVRVSGLFLAVALVVQWLVTSRSLRALPWLATPFGVLLVFSAHLHALTGDWLRWLHAQESGWGRRLSWPWDAFSRSWDAAFGSSLPDEYVWSARAELLAVLVGALVTVLLLRRRLWGEAVYVGLSVAALATSTSYLSVARATLLWFPLWLLLAGWLDRRWARERWVPAYLAVAGPLMAVNVLTFTSGRWVG
jgi:hypothetical protein